MIHVSNNCLDNIFTVSAKIHQILKNHPIIDSSRSSIVFIKGPHLIKAQLNTILSQ